MTYVAATITPVMILLYWLSPISGRRDSSMEPRPPVERRAVSYRQLRPTGGRAGEGILSTAECVDHGPNVRKVHFQRGVRNVGLHLGTDWRRRAGHVPEGIHRPTHIQKVGLRQ